MNQSLRQKKSAILLSLFVIFLFNFANSARPERLISETLGIVNNEILTSREMILSVLLENSLDKGSKGLPSTKDEKIQAVNTLLLDKMVDFEAQNLGFKDLDKDEVKKLVGSLEKSLQDPELKIYRFQAEDLKSNAERKLIVRNFLKSKSGSFLSLLTEQDIQTYFDKNRLRFGSMPYAQIKENIRAYLTQQQREERLVAWIEVLKKKYAARNYLIESQKSKEDSKKRD
jgi:hypothetical protein